MAKGAAAEKTTLALGGEGALSGASFTLASRTLVKGEAGAIWNEWRMAFADGREAWLAETPGALTVYFEGALAPAFDALSVGAAPALDWVVVERGRATRVKTWGGDAPSPRAYAYADLSGRDGRRATIDYGEKTPRTFVGERVTFAKLGLRPAGPSVLFAVSGGRPARDLEPALPVGLEGTLGGERVTIRGIMQRAMRIDGEAAAWNEYLLASASGGLSWLTCSDGHWNHVKGVEAGLVRESEDGERATFEGAAFRAVASGTARVTYLEGELPWPARVGDATSVCDFVSAPRVLSCEWTDDEITWSVGEYAPPEAILRAFGRRALPKPVGRAPNSPRKDARRPRR